ncbi:hypothetical protein [Tropicimonas sediminicola]|uniref:Uncharacterized protein n=1 Tax=Tropicimonas sediminicola TaxID=1031541 RepID=A0A239FT95_9RHOB|nr:hypothetical protein [Tropicimonas sediminicola]SNS59124.1 hypothetical protein SAMN05421757_102791 [Tropicimonas sediminicola]
MGRNLRLAVWNRGLVLVLMCVLIVPQVVPAVATDAAEHHVSAPADPHHDTGHHHPEATDHCHPGIDCHFQAIVEINGMPVLIARLDGQAVLPDGLSEPGLEHGFDPPPPRVRS